MSHFLLSVYAGDSKCEKLLGKIRFNAQQKSGRRKIQLVTQEVGVGDPVDIRPGEKQRGVAAASQQAHESISFVFCTNSHQVSVSKEVSADEDSVHQASCGKRCKAQPARESASIARNGHGTKSASISL
jgi:hypothetical protein